MRIYNFIVLVIAIVFVIKLDAKIQPYPIFTLDIPYIPKQHFEVLTLNTWGLPIWYPNSNKKLRYPMLCNSIATNEFEIICLQEVFDPKLQSQIIKILSENNYNSLGNYNNHRFVSNIIEMDTEGGLMTWSKFPVIFQKFFRYPIEDEMKFEEKIGAKGFIITTLDLGNNKKLNVINTHMYSGNDEKAASFRLKQFLYLKKILDSNPDFTKIPIILLGDLNIQHLSSQNIKTGDILIHKMLQTMFNQGESSPVNNPYTYDPFKNNYCNKKHGRQKLDYIFSNIKQYRSILQEVLFMGQEAISDHCGLKAKFTN